MSNFFCKSGSGVVQFAAQAWSNGDRMVPALSDNSANVLVGCTAVWECTTSGSTTGTPVWPASVTYDTTTVSQNGVVFTARKPGYSSGSTVNWSFATPFLDYLELAKGVEGVGARGLVSHQHAESRNAAMTLTSIGTVARPSETWCVNDGVTSNFSCTTGASVEVISTNQIFFNGSFHFYGIQFKFGTGSASVPHIIGGFSVYEAYTIFENCVLNVQATDANLFATGSGQTLPVRLRFFNTTMRFGSANNRIIPHRAIIEWIGGSIVSGSATPSALFQWITGAVSGFVHINAVDFSNFGSSFSFVVTPPAGNGRLTVENCKLPALWTGDLTDAALTSTGFVAELVNCDSADTNFRYRKTDCYGSVRESTTVVPTGGATDGTTLKSWRLTGSASAGNAAWSGIETNDISLWNETIGSQITLTAEVVSNSAALLTNAELYMIVTYLGTSGNPLASIVSTRPSQPLAATASLTTSTKSWDSQATARGNNTAYVLGDAIKLGTNAGRIFFCTQAGTSAGSEPGGYASAIDGGSVSDGTAAFRAGWRQKISISFTPQEKGPVAWRFGFNKASSTCYVDRDVTQS